MTSKNEISDLMVSHHALIEALLALFKESLGVKGPEAISSSLDSLKWEFEKHIFVEEKVIFRFCSQEDTETCKIVQNLIVEHDTMVDMLNAIENELAVKEEVGVLRFQNLLERHRDLEEKFLYPKLDRELDRAQKEEIIAKINEIPLKEKR